mmetsp:Transcript_69780/g.102246  ORF Transcript_69780/g.102246 Transcript_69780/m.102246 type:complete len:200 (+) Transcript_69780:332-931(+)
MLASPASIHRSGRIVHPERDFSHASTISRSACTLSISRFRSSSDSFPPSAASKAVSSTPDSPRCGGLADPAARRQTALFLISGCMLERCAAGKSMYAILGFECDPQGGAHGRRELRSSARSVWLAYVLMVPVHSASSFSMAASAPASSSRCAISAELTALRSTAVDDSSTASLSQVLHKRTSSSRPPILMKRMRFESLL